MGKASRFKKERAVNIEKLKLWHYTTDQHLSRITSDGFIKPSSILIGENERPAVWFSSNPDWERSVTKKVVLSDSSLSKPLQRDDMLDYGLGPVRIEIDSSLIKLVNWKTYKKVSGILVESAKWLECAGIDEGADPNEWYASFSTIFVDTWISIDFWNRYNWIPFLIGEENV